MGTPNFAAVSLLNIIHSGFNVVGVFSQPPKPVGRGYEVTKSPVHALAEEFNIPVFTPTTFKSEDSYNLLSSLAPDIVVVAAYGFILPQRVLDLPPLGCINVHGSLLPRWRGAAPIQHAILSGDTETGVTIMHMSLGMDEGDMLLMNTIPILSSSTTFSLLEEMADLGGKSIVQFLEHRLDYAPIPQPMEGVTIAPKITKEQGVIDWNEPAEYIERMLRAFTPWPGISTLLEGVPLKIGGLSILNATHSTTPGTVLTDDLCVACGNGTVLRIEKLQKPGARMMATEEFLNGLSILIGAFFK
jgi:methionyl-tRNA formyltransferase